MKQGTAVELRRQDVVWAYVILRLALGINIFVHGLVRIGDIPGFVQSQVGLYKDLPVPGWLIAGPAFMIPIVELIAGFLIVIGLKTRIAIAAGFLLMLPLIFGTCLLQEWSSAANQLIYCLVYFVLLAGCNFNNFSVDQFRRNHQD